MPFAHPLGQKGWTKWYLSHPRLLRNSTISFNYVDPDIQRGGDNHKRWSYYSAEHSSSTSRRKDGQSILYPFELIQRSFENCFQLVDLSAAQDVEAGDGTTSVVVLAGSLLGAAEKMLQKGMHPTIIAEAFLKASAKSVEYLTEISTPVDLSDKPSLLRAASTSLNSKVSLTAGFDHRYISNHTM